MKYVNRFLIGLAISSTSVSVHAGIIESVQGIIKNKCAKELASDEALRLVKVLYLNCVPKTKVEVFDSCMVECLRENTGGLVGQ